MKRIVILVVLVAIAGVAGVVRSSVGSVSELRSLVHHKSHQDAPSAGDVRQEIREKFELAPGARVEVSGLNGSVKIETSDTKTAEIYIERSASSQEALDRRKVLVEADGSSLRIRGEKNDDGFFSRFFGSSASERTTLKLPRQISLYTKGVNGPVTSGEIDGAVEITGVNGKVQVGSAVGRAQFKGINGSLVVGLKKIDLEGVTLSGINGNIELQLGADVNADFEARGMNGSVVSDLANVAIDKNKRSSYTARIGSGGAAISAKGINGNIRFTRGAVAAAAPAAEVAATDKH